MELIKQNVGFNRTERWRYYGKIFIMWGILLAYLQLFYAWKNLHLNFENAAIYGQEIHEGRNVKRFREMMGIKQEALAYDLCEDWNQKKVSLLGEKETIDVPLLQQIAAILKLPVEAFQRFDEQQAVNIIASTFHDSAVANSFTEGAQANFHCTFNPLDKVMELFERLLASEREKVELMKEILERMK